MGDVVTAYIRLTGEYRDCAARLTDLQLFQLGTEGRAQILDNDQE